ncbi:excinuclease ABC subunit C, partial [Enterococcus faecium]
MLKEKMKTLPMLQGGYLMKDQYGKVNYVGKAK